jgi:hypothetical protein
MQIELKLRQTNVRAGQGNGQVSGCDWDWGIVWVWWQLVGRESDGWWVGGGGSIVVGGT